jgi:hypothetical protein
MVGKIKYPADTGPARPPRARTPADGPSQQAIPREDSPQKEAPRQLQSSVSQDSLNRAISPPAVQQQLPTQLGNVIQTEKSITRSESGDLAATKNGPPQRPRREGDEDYINPNRAMSPNSTSPTGSSFPIRVTSPNTNGPASPPNKNGFNPSVLGTRSPSPRLRNLDDRPAPPPDAFYYSKSPTVNGYSARPGSLSGAGDLMKELKAKEVEVETAKRREGALRVIVGRAVQQGFVASAEEDIPQLDEGNDEVVRKLADALVRLKQEKAAIQVSRDTGLADGRTTSRVRCGQLRKRQTRPNDYARALFRKLRITEPRWPLLRLHRLVIWPGWRRTG